MIAIFCGGLTNGAQQTWIQNYGYDRYGNRNSFSQNILGQQLAMTNVTLPTVDANTNRFANGQGYIYDKIGNLKKDVTASQSRDIKFDGNNKQTEIKDSATGYKIGEYFYDGNGKRVKKRVFDESGQAIEDVIFVYSGDRIIAEYSTQPPPSNPTTKYVATDMLGSIRAITNQDGQVVSRRDFMPFGEELQPDTNYRKSSLKYNPDDVRQKFTGYQKDEESGLDFAEARMYKNAHGRFTAVDPLLASGKSANPQTFNRYVYTMNRPMVLSDPTGLQSGRKPERDVITIDTQLSKKAPQISGVKVTLPNGKQIEEDLFIGDRFVISYTYRINKPDKGQDATSFSKIENVTGTLTTKWDENGKPVENIEEERKSGSFSGDLVGAKAAGKPRAAIVGDRNDEVEVTVSQEFEITGDSATTRGGSNQVNFQIVVVDPKAPVDSDRNSSLMKRGQFPANPAIFTTKRKDVRKEVEIDEGKAVSYRNRRRN